MNDVVEITVRITTPNKEATGEVEHFKQRFVYPAPAKELKAFIDKIKTHAVTDEVKTIIEKK